MGERLTIRAEWVIPMGSFQWRWTGRKVLDEAPSGGLAVTASGRALEVGDTFTAVDGDVIVIRHEALLAFINPRRAWRVGTTAPMLSALFSVLLPVASALFGWLR